VHPDKKTRKTILQKQFFEFREKQLELMKPEKSDSKKEENVEEDDLWQTSAIPERYYESVLNKELHWFPRSKNFQTDIQRKMSYL